MPRTATKSKPAAKRRAVATTASPLRLLVKPQYEKGLDAEHRHIITRDLTNGIEWCVTEFGGKAFTAKQAEAACAELRTGGHADWRQPTIQELLTTVDYGKKWPAIDQEFFPNAKDSWYRTSTPYAPFPGYSWGVGFGDGLSGTLDPDHHGFVRAVRASQS